MTRRKTREKKQPKTEGHCSKARAIVKSCSPELAVRTSQAAPQQKVELVLFIGEEPIHANNVVRVPGPCPPSAAMGSRSIPLASQS